MTCETPVLLEQYQRQQAELVRVRRECAGSFLSSDDVDDDGQRSEVERLLAEIQAEQRKAQQFADIVSHMAIASTVGKQDSLRKLAERPVPRRVLVAQARKLENEQMRQAQAALAEETARIRELIADTETLLDGRRAENRELQRQLGEHFRTPEQLLAELAARQAAAQHAQAASGCLEAVSGELAALAAETRDWQQQTVEQIAWLRGAAVDFDERKNGRGQLAMKLYNTVLNERKQIWNQIQDLKGSIRVFCRIRPSGEAAVAPSAALENTVTVVHKGKKRRFEFDRVFGPSSTQSEVFEDTKPLIRSVIDGYNVCIFAYGQTGSGKTHTMQGTACDPGVNTRALTELFQVTEARTAHEGFAYELLVSVFEIYNDGVYDLLQRKRVVLDVRQGPDGMDVVGSQAVPVASMDDVAAVLRAGEKNRSTASTDQNAHSSRSHLLLRVRVLGHNLVTGERTAGKLTLVDLAGSERLGRSGAAGATAKETAHINTSLAHLGNVIASLQQPGEHVPYRNSRLTYLLQDSLGGGDSKTLVFVQVDSQDSNVGESIQTLSFGLRVRNVDLGQAKRNTTATSST